MFYEAIFFVQMGLFFFILLAQLYNVMGAGSVFDLRVSILMFIGALVSYGLGLVVVMIYSDASLMVAILKLETWLWVLQVLFLIINVFLVMGKQGLKGAYKANEQER